MPIVQADGVKLHVQQLGKSGSSIVMVHGAILGSLPTWMFGVGPRLAKRHIVTLYDMRGHGGSDRPSSGYDLVSMAGDLRYVAQNVADGARAVVGYSYGGAVALRYAALHPGELDHLILVEAPLPVFSEEWLEDLMQEDREEALERLTPAHRELLQRIGGRESRLVRQARELVEETSLMEDLQLRSHITDEDLAQVDCSVLLVYGENSDGLVDAREHLLREIRNSKLELVSGGHYLPLDVPQKLADVIEAFLDG